MTTVRGVLLIGTVPFITYGAMWLTTRCAEDVRTLVRHVRGGRP